MNLISHQFKTDLRHFRWQILPLWIAFAVGPLVLVMNLTPDGFSLVSSLAMLWQIIGGTFLTVSVIQADALVGTSAPWLTRPIRRRHLFWAKTLFLITLILLPRLIFQSIAWLGRGYSAHLILCAAGESMLYGSTVVLSAAVLAALTRNLTRFFIALGIMAGGIFLWAAAVSVMVKIGMLQRSATFWADYEAMISSRLIAAYIFMATSALLAWIGQAYLRRWRFAVALFALGLLAFPLITIRWKTNFLKAKLTDAPPLAVEIIRTNSPVEGQRIFAEMAIKGVPKNQVAIAQEMWASLRIDGKTHYISPRLPAGVPGRVRPGRSRQQLNYIKEVKNCFPTNTLWFESSYMGGFDSAFLDQELLNFYRQAPPGELRGNVALDLYEVRKIAEVPLKPASIKTLPGQQVAIRRVAIVGNEIVADLEESSVNLSLDRDPVTATGGWPSNTDPLNAYVLYQPDSGEAYLAAQTTANRVGSDPVSREVRATVRLTFRYSDLRERLAGITAAEWLRTARLCVFTPFYRGSAHIAFTEENYQRPSDFFSQLPTADSDGMKTIENATLPETPTAPQLEAYLDTILFNAPDAESTQDTRQKIQSKLSAIGANGLPALLRRLPLSEQQDYYLALPVINNLVTRDHLPELLAALERDTRLTRVIVQKHWEAEALPVFRRMLSDHRHVLPADALRIVANAKIPATYADLRWHFVRLQSSTYLVFPALENCPGFDLAGAVTEAWNHLNLQVRGDFDLTVAAAKLGLPDALSTAVVELESIGNEDLLKRTLPQLAEMTGYSGPSTNEVTWLGKNLDKLRFDPNLRRYVVEQ